MNPYEAGSGRSQAPCATVCATVGNGLAMDAPASHPRPTRPTSRPTGVLQARQAWVGRAPRAPPTKRSPAAPTLAVGEIAGRPGSRPRRRSLRRTAGFMHLTTDNAVEE